jgi:ABC-type Fe3+/spermidine/putrescine transport system ATPase subunit
MNNADQNINKKIFYGAMILGPSGSGKTTLCNGL